MVNRGDKKFIRCLAVGLVIGTGALCGCQSRTLGSHRLEAQRNLDRLRAQAKYQLATQMIDQGGPAEAIPLLREAIRLDPMMPTYHRTLASCNLDLGHIASADVAAKTADGLGDRSAELSYVRGVTEERRSDYPKAIEHYQEAVRRDPTNVDYVLAMAQCQVTAQDEPAAYELLCRSVVDLDSPPRLLAFRAQLALLRRDWRQAVSDFAAAGDHTLSSPWRREQYGMALLQLGEYDRAGDVLAPLVEPDPIPLEDSNLADWQPSPSLTRALAIAYLRGGRVDDAKVLLQRHLLAHPRDARGWWLLTETALRLGDGRTAKQCCRAGYALAPNQPFWQMAEAIIARTDGDSARSAQLLQTVLAEHPHDTRVLCFLGDIRLETSDNEAARALYNDALRIDPDCAWAKSRLAGGLSDP